MSAYPSLMSRSPREEVVHGLHKAAELARRIMQARHTGMGLQDLEDELDELIDYFDSRTYLGAKSLLEANDKKRVAEEEATLRRRIWDYMSELGKGLANPNVSKRYRHIESLLAELDRAFAAAERPVNQSPLPSRVEIIRTADIDITPDPQLWVDAIKGALPPNDYAKVAEALALVTKHLERLNKKIAAMGAGPIVAAPPNLQLTGGQLDSIRQPVDLSQATLATLATQTTLQALLNRLSRPAKAATALASVPAGTTYTTVVEFTPTTGVSVDGYNADFQTLTTAAYRMRLITGTDASPSVWHGEEVSTTANSWVPFRFDIAANTRVAVQIIHDQLTTQSVRATINYLEG